MKQLPVVSSNSQEISESVAVILMWYTPSSRHRYATPSNLEISVVLYREAPSAAALFAAPPPDHPSPAESCTTSLYKYSPEEHLGAGYNEGSGDGFGVEFGVGGNVGPGVDSGDGTAQTREQYLGSEQRAWYQVAVV